jgi:hypothetical protein
MKVSPGIGNAFRDCSGKAAISAEPAPRFESSRPAIMDRLE